MASISQQQSKSVDSVYRLSNLTVRILSALVLIPLFVSALIIGGPVWALLIGLVAALGSLEYYALARGRDSQGYAPTGVAAALSIIAVFFAGEPLLTLPILLLALIVTFTLEWVRHPDDADRTFWQTFSTMTGILYVALPLAFLVALRGYDDGLVWCGLIVLGTWGTDTAAYFGGRRWGKRKLAPKLSPKKTVEGAVVGVIGGILPSLVLLAAADYLNTLTALMVTLTPFVAIAGDLFESALKRFFKVKDSHLTGFNIIPGHGGVLDRIDALLMVAVFVYAFVMLAGLV